MLAKRFFHVCAGLLCLALAYYLGATRGHGRYMVAIPADRPPCAWNTATGELWAFRGGAEWKALAPRLDRAR